MSAVAFLESRGLKVTLADGGGLNIKGLSSLSKEERAMLLPWIRQHKPELALELSAVPCPLHHLNAHDIGVDISTKRGLILTAGFVMTESLRAHVTLWTLSRWDALLAALGWEGQEMPRRVEVRSLNLYQLPRGAAA